MKIREICDRGLFTEADIRFFKKLGDRDIEALIQFVPDEPSLARELERRRRQRHKKHPLTGGPGGVGSPQSNDVPAAPAEVSADGAGSAALAPMITGGGPTLR
jgi:hypothetical protein